jgi:hypothetical protein
MDLPPSATGYQINIAVIELLRPKLSYTAEPAGYKLYYPKTFRRLAAEEPDYASRPIKNNNDI